MILIMSVFAGFGGQMFIPESLEKICATKKLIDAHHKNILLSVDGGIKVNNIHDVVKAGANFIVMGSELFDAENYATCVGQVREKI
jgi:ribulose-phosphate 3-epimerase